MNPNAFPFPPDTPVEGTYPGCSDDDCGGDRWVGGAALGAHISHHHMTQHFALPAHSQACLLAYPHS